MRLVTPLEMMKLEDLSNQAGCTYDIMMEAAGKGLADFLIQYAAENGQETVVFLCGTGNNAGDCFVAARLIADRLRVKICLVSGVPKTRTAFTKYNAMQQITKLTEPADITQAVMEHSLIVDGIFGIGFRGELSPFVQELFSIIHADKTKKCVGVDIPSGGSGLTGAVTEGTPHCDVTLTFGAAKRGLFLSPLSEHTGKIRFVDIGIPESAFSSLPYPVTNISEETVHAALPVRPISGHKGMFGRLLIVAGSRNMPGAAMLTTAAALRCGVGTCCIASNIDVCRMVVTHSPESMMLPIAADLSGMLTTQALHPILEYARECTAVVIGCGLGQSGDIRALVSGLISSLECPIILDADGLNAIANSIDILQKAKEPVILTPHPGEMSRLLHTTVSDVTNDRIAAAKRLAERYPNTVVVLKGAGTVVAAADHACINMTGNSGMSKGGSGDVLAGMIGSFAAQGIPAEQAAQCGVFLHGLAGDCAAAEFTRRAMLPSDMIRQLPLLFGEYE